MDYINGQGGNHGTFAPARSNGEVLRLHHYSVRTEEAYLQWVKRFSLFHYKRNPAEMGETEISAYLNLSPGCAGMTDKEVQILVIWMTPDYVQSSWNPLLVSRINQSFSVAARQAWPGGDAC